MDKKYFVYRHTSPSGGVYIGITTNPKLRFSQNGEKYKGCHIFYNAIQKYGWDNFNHEILFEGLTKSEADKKEKELIAFYKNSGISYNIAEGGAGTPIKWSDESRRKQSERRKKYCQIPEVKEKLIKQLRRAKLSEDGRRRISEANSGERNAMYGKPRSKEVREKISSKLKGRNLPDEVKEKIKEYLRKNGHPMSGKKHSVEARKKMSASRLGLAPHNKGMIYVCNVKGETKKIRPEELESYLLTGMWQRGIKWR